MSLLSNRICRGLGGMTESKQEPSGALKRAESRIPDFRTFEEAGEFWDTHSLADFKDELEEVTDVRFVRPRLKKAITVRLESETLAALTQQAREKGIGPATLVRMWILEHLRELQEQKSHS